MTYINEHSMTSAYCQATTGAEFDAFDANLMSYELDISMIRQIGTTRLCQSATGLVRYLSVLPLFISINK